MDVCFLYEKDLGAYLLMTLVMLTIPAVNPYCYVSFNSIKPIAI